MLLVVGQIGKPHGIRGEVTVEVRTDEPEARFAPGSVLTTEPGVTPSEPGAWRVFADFVPTGGVNADNLGSWLDAGAIAVGAGGDLCSTADLRDGDWTALTSRARKFSDAATAWREARA